MAQIFTDENVSSIIASGKPVIIDFWAEWCGPCRRLSPIIEEVANEYGDKIIVGKYNVDDETELAVEYRIQSIPTLLFFKNGENQKDLRSTGLLPKSEILSRVEALLTR